MLGGDRFYETTGVRRVGQVDIRRGRGCHGEAFVTDYLGGGEINWIQIELDPNVIHIRQRFWVGRKWKGEEEPLPCLCFLLTDLASGS